MTKLNRRACLKLAAGAAVAGFGTGALPAFPNLTRRAFAADAPSGQNTKKAIVIYYSRTGNTEALAKRIAERTGADTLRLDVKTPYAPNYGDMTDIAREEVRSGARRELSTVIPDLSGYDTVFLGTPYWWGSISVPMNTFLLDHNLAGKTVAPFITSGSSSPEGALSRMKTLCPQATFVEHFYVPGSGAKGAGAEIDAWLKRLGF